MVKMQLIGHLGADCMLNNVNGKNVINFQACHTEKFKDASGTQRETSLWVSCAYWTEKTGISQYLKKGTQIYAEGIPEPKHYTDRSGKVVPQISLRVSQIQLLGSANKDNQNQNTGGGYAQSIGNPQGNYKETVNYSEASGDDLPF